MKQLINQKDFLIKYNIEVKDFEKTTLKWADLQVIFQNYCTEIPKLEASAIYIFNNLMKTNNVHSVRYRIKHEEHVIEKIIRKRINNPAKIITLENYKTELTDLIGLRAIHLFKEDWLSIHDLITTTWDLKEKPVVNYRDGDSVEYLKKFEELDCDIKEHEFGYRSIHYIVESKPAKRTYFAEIQVRTIFEEAWSEIDHTIRYPYDQDNPLFGRFLLILNRLAGSADEMGTFIKYLKIDLQQKEDKHLQIISEKDKLIKELESKIKQLKLKAPDLQFLTDGLEKLKLSDMSWMDNYKPIELSDMSWIDKYKPIELPDMSWLQNLNSTELPKNIIIPKKDNK
jgi:ppGpp synthetase/RelA/SpoT-type nucleotidyltranferase